MAKEDSMQTISRAIHILKSFSREEKELSLADLHRKLGLSKASLQRILNTLVLYGIVDKNEERKTYRLGIELYFLGHLVEKNSNILSIANPHMKDLNKLFDETVSLSIIHQNQRKCIGYVASNHELMALTYIGQYSPLYAGASAKALMAYLSDQELNEILDGLTLEPITKETITDKEKLKKEIQTIREQGFAISNSERVVGSFSISSPIIDRFNKVIAAITLMIPTVRVDESKMETYIKHVKETASIISQKLS
ncbi:IclR family transcriptional regulator [Peribacillus cavernae]|uniref:IclR family transcriptional regulator n=1 Tax=Peribacillus cavernae TaxID=1674310 RepID=A0A3S0W504_9BACI|nr:IclR family transcriptional regulator [Peribacillus cavernae]MDQ0219259.1 DNA-binding IclR family transcriptional regulator [Peribacillus cavernae]RUQ27843.1 IclR family transcriptional regulator [Peribacillus cavernae]